MIVVLLLASFQILALDASENTACTTSGGDQITPCISGSETDNAWRADNFDQVSLLAVKAHVLRPKSASLRQDKTKVFKSTDSQQIDDTYEGSEAGSQHTMKIRGFQPQGEGSFPVYVYLPGTFDKFATPHDLEFTKYMSSKGFVAVTVGYENNGFCLDICRQDGDCQKGFLGKTPLMSKARQIQGALDHICSGTEYKADCEKGLALMGHSQGGYLTALLAVLDARVSAIMPLGIGPVADRDWEGLITSAYDNKCILDEEMTKHLPRMKRRYINGENDLLSHGDTKNDNRGLEGYSGYNCDASNTPVNCIQPDGSGYYIVGENEYDEQTKWKVRLLAGHNFFSNSDPIKHWTEFLPMYMDGAAPWCFQPSLNWLAQAALRVSPEPPSPGTSFEPGQPVIVVKETADNPCVHAGTEGTVVRQVQDAGQVKYEVELRSTKLLDEGQLEATGMAGPPEGNPSLGE